MSDYFIFGNIDTRDYEGIYVYFDDIDAIPSRVGEFIEIPGRNGSFYLDKGRYEDVTHTYDIVALTMEAGRNLINAISSQIGYQRLEDSFNPNEFYSAVFTSEVEPNVPTDREQMTFKLMFTRKPQRFLTSGETAVSVDSGDTLTNPTLFESSPQLQLWGEGTISLGGQDISLDGDAIGDIQVYGGGTPKNTPIVIDDTYANTGDLIEVASVSGTSIYQSSQTITPQGILVITGDMIANKYVASNYAEINGSLDPDQLIFEYGTAKTVSGTAQQTFRLSDRSLRTIYLNLSLAYDGADTFTYTGASSGRVGAMILHSTQYTTGAPAYIDLETGECYKIENGSTVSINNSVTMPAKLPTLPSGTTTITFDNTFTQVKIVPRWWKV